MYLPKFMTGKAGTETAFDGLACGLFQTSKW